MQKQELYRKIYDSIKTPPYVPSISYPLNKTNIESYLASYNSEAIRHILRILFNNTIHISYNTFQTSLYTQFESFINYCKNKNITKISLYLDNVDENAITQKSNFWVAQHFYQYLKTNNIKLKINIIYNKENIKFLNNKELILILDDCSYTGEQLSSILKDDFKSDYRVYNIYILIAYISNNAMTKIKLNIPQNINIVFSEYNKIIENFYSLLTPIQIKLAEFLQIKDKYLIYFDHKLADCVSIYTEIYSGKIIGTEEVIPVINNCEEFNTIDDIDILKPKCPITPYKIDSKDYEKYRGKIKRLETLTTFSSVREEKDEILVNYNDLLDKIPKTSYVSSFIKTINSRLKKSKFTIKSETILYKLMQNFPLIPLYNYKLSTEKIEEYYTKINDEKLLNIIKTIIDNIIYINYSDYIKNLRDKIIDLLNLLKDTKRTSNIKLYIYNIVSTNRWVSQILYHSFGEIKIEIIENIQEIKEGDFVIYADDFIHTDNNINPLLSLNINYTLYILTSYIIEKVNKQLSKLVSSTKVSSKKIIYTLLLSSNIKIVTTIDKYLSDEDLKYLCKKTTFNFKYKYILYADHNIYNFIEGNALPILYGSIYDNDYLIDKNPLKLFSIIENCDETKLGTFIDPKCPRKIYE